MEKVEMREWVSSLEEMVNRKLPKWDKHRKWENGDVVNLMWQWEYTLIKIDVFWQDKKEIVRLKFIGPRADHDFMEFGLGDKTFDKLQDRIGNLAMSIMHPPIDPLVEPELNG